MPLGANLSYTQFETLLSRVRTFGRITEARLYCDSEKGTLARAHRGHVERLGVNLVDCPTSDKKEAVDKKIIVDCLVWAVARAARSQPCAVVLISGDGDFAHMLSRLNNLGVRTIAIGRSRALQSVAVTSLTLREACGAEVGSPPPSGRGTKRPAAAAAGPSSSRASPAPGAKRQKAAAAAAPRAPRATPTPRSKAKQLKKKPPSRSSIKKPARTRKASATATKAAASAAAASSSSNNGGGKSPSKRKPPTPRKKQTATSKAKEAATKKPKKPPCQQHWGGLSAAHREMATRLGFTKATWVQDNWAGVPWTWDDLPSDRRQDAVGLCFTQATWAKKEP
jgi:hypothetical protein